MTTLRPSKNYTVERVYLETQTLGSMYDDSNRELICKTMELPYRDNARSSDSSKASCVPEGVYLLVKQPPKESRPYGYFRFMHVRGRSINSDGMSSILIHRITNVQDLLGCIGVGGKFVNIDADKDLEMVESSKTLQWMYENLPDEFTLTIKKKP